MGASSAALALAVAMVPGAAGMARRLLQAPPPLPRPGGDWECNTCICCETTPGFVKGWMATNKPNQCECDVDWHWGVVVPIFILAAIIIFFCYCCTYGHWWSMFRGTRGKGGNNGATATPGATAADASIPPPASPVNKSRDLRGSLAMSKDSTMTAASGPMSRAPLGPLNGGQRSLIPAATAQQIVAAASGGPLVGHYAIPRDLTDVHIGDIGEWMRELPAEDEDAILLHRQRQDRDEQLADSRGHSHSAAPRSAGRNRVAPSAAGASSSSYGLVAEVAEEYAGHRTSPAPRGRGEERYGLDAEVGGGREGGRTSPPRRSSAHSVDAEVAKINTPREDREVRDRAEARDRARGGGGGFGLDAELGGGGERREVTRYGKDSRSPSPTPVTSKSRGSASFGIEAELDGMASASQGRKSPERHRDVARAAAGEVDEPASPSSRREASRLARQEGRTTSPGVGRNNSFGKGRVSFEAPGVGGGPMPLEPLGGGGLKPLGGGGLKPLAPLGGGVKPLAPLGGGRKPLGGLPPL